MERTDEEIEELRERLKRKHLIAIAKEGVELGKIFYHIDAPKEPWEIIRLAFVEGGSYWWVVNFESREMRLLKSSEIKDSNLYLEYFKTEKECIEQRIKNMEEELQQEKDKLIKDYR